MDNWHYRLRNMTRHELICLIEDYNNYIEAFYCWKLDKPLDIPQFMEGEQELDEL